MSTVRETYSLSEIGDAIPQLVEHFRRELKPNPVTVTDEHGKPVLVILPWKLYRLINQALEVGMEPLRSLKQQKLGS